jgi:hypothetical protein
MPESSQEQKSAHVFQKNVVSLRIGISFARNALACVQSGGAEGVPNSLHVVFPENWIHSPWKRLVVLLVGDQNRVRRLTSQASLRGVVGDVVGRAGGENARVPADEKRPFEEPAALVVQEVFVPAILDQFGNDHDNLAVGMLG